MRSLQTTDPRNWIGLGCYSLVLIILGMIAWDRQLLDSDAFLILATAIVITGWNGGPVGWAYQATKSGGEQAESTARIAETAAGVPMQPTAHPQQVEVVNSAGNPAKVEEVR